MKNYLKTLIVFLLVFVLSFAFVSCGAPEEEPPAEDPPSGENPGGNEGEDDPSEGDDDDSHENDYRLRFVYSYTALVTNDNNRDDYKKEVVTVGSIYINKDNNGIPADILTQIENLSYNGYTFVDWYAKEDWDTDTQSGTAGKEIDFATYGKVSGDLTFYGERGDLAGANAKWSITFADKDGNPIDITTVDSGKYPDGTNFKASDVKESVLTISGTGAMFNFQNANGIDLPWYDYRKMVTKIVIGDGITAIGNNSFGGFTALKGVEFNDDITDIGISAFAGCSNRAWRVLETPASLKRIGNGAFTDTYFKEIVFNDGLLTIGDSAFSGSTILNTVIVPTSLQSIGIAAFNPGVSSGATIDKVYYKGTPEQYAELYVSMDNAWFNEFPVTYFYTEDEAVGNSGYQLADGTSKPCWHFAEVNGVVTKTPIQYCYTISYRIPGEKLAFTAHYVPVSPVLDENGNIQVDADEIPKLQGIITEDIVKAREELTYHNMKFVGFKKVGNAPETLVAGDAITADIMYEVDRGNIISDGGGLIWSFDSSSGTLRISVNPNAPEGASYKMWDLVNALDTGALWAGGFGKLNTIKKLIIDDGVEYIGKYAFTSLTSITEVVIPASCKGIANNAFDGSSNLINIYYMGSNVEDCVGLVNEDGSTALSGIRSSVYGKTDVPVATPGNYWMEIQTDNGVKRLCWILTADETLEGDTIVYSNGALRIGGDSVMYDFEHAEQAPWYGAKSYLTSVSFTNNITNIAENVVNGYSGIVSISLPASARIVPASAFAGTGIVNDYSKYNKGLLVIDGVLLKASPALMNKTLVETYNGITIIAGDAFVGCDAIKRIYVAATVQYINNGAFADSEIEYVFYDGGADGWTGISANAGLNVDIAVYYRSDNNPGTDNQHWHKVGNDYAIWGCVHKFGDWEVVKESTCVLQGSQIRYCIYDAAHTETEALPLNDNHNLVPYENGGKYEITAADCLNDATIKYVCTNLSSSLKKCSYTEQVAIVEGEEGYEKALGHDFKNYYSNNDWDCLTSGTLTAVCERCQNAEDTIIDPEHISIGSHTWGEYTFDDNATCVEDGTQSRICLVCETPDEPVVVVDSHLDAAHVFTEQIEDAKYFDKYVSDTSASFFISCKLCQTKSPYTFVKEYASIHDYSDGTLPSYYNGGSNCLTSNGESGGFIIIKDEDGNKFLRIGKDASSGAENIVFWNLPNGSEIVSNDLWFDFRWNGGDKASSDGTAGFVKAYEGEVVQANPSYVSSALSCSGSGAPVSIFGHSFAIGQWYRINVSFNYTEEGKTDVDVYVYDMEGTLLKKNDWATSNGRLDKFTIHPRGGWRSISFDIDNAMLYTDNGLVYENTVCEGEHNFGSWIDDGKQDCLTEGALYRVCQADGCNVVEKSDEVLPAIGHKFVADGEEGDGYYAVDATCTSKGYWERKCLVCGFIEGPIYDMDAEGEEGYGEDDFPILDHVWDGDEALNGFTLVAPDCTNNGYYVRVCTECDLEQIITDFNGDGEDDEDLKALGHDYTAEGVEGDGYTIVPATCTEDGYWTATCLVCGYVDVIYDKDGDEINDFPTDGEHRYVEDGAEGDGYTLVAPNCTEDGYYTATCLDCGYVSNVYDKDNDGVNDLPAVGHKLFEEGDETLGYIKVDATCTENGYYYRECLVCDYVEDPTYDLDGDEVVDLPASCIWSEYVPDNNSTCTAVGTMTRTCTVCGETETVDNPDDPMDPHVVNTYYADKPADCFNNAIETGICEVCDNFISREVEGTKLEHKYGPATYIPGTATCQHGDKTVRVCRLCGYEDGQIPEEGKIDHSYVQVMDDKYFAGYPDNTSVTYFESCEWCGAKGPFTFTCDVLVLDNLDSATLPAGVAFGTAKGEVNGSSIKAGYRFMTEKVGDVVNSFIRYQQINNGSSYALDFTIAQVEGVDTYYAQHDFRWGGATNIRDGMPMTSKFKDSKGEAHNQPVNFYATENGDLHIGSASSKIIAPVGEWVTFLYEFTRLDDGFWTIKLYVNGELAVSTKTRWAVEGAVKFTYEPRYPGPNVNYNNMIIDFDNMLNYTPIVQDLVTNVCPDGEHDLSVWYYNKDGNCVTDGTRTAVCQNGTCNYTVTEIDPDHLATGEHTLTDWIYNGDRTCETAGTVTQSCTGCGLSETKTDAENYPALGHAYGDPVTEPGTANCQHGTIIRSVCANGCGVDIIDYENDKAEDHSRVEVASPEFFAGYANATTAKYFKTCEWCGEKLVDTFNVAIVTAHNFDDGTIPTYLASNVSGTSMWKTVTSETVNDAVNYYLSIGKKDNGGTNATSWTVTPDANGKKTIVSFDFRWMGVTNVRMSDGNQPIILKILEGSAAKASESFILPEGVLDGSQVNIHNVIFNTGDWHNITYEFTRSANGATKVDCLIDGVVTKTFNFTSTSTLTIRYETRYGAAAHANTVYPGTAAGGTSNGNVDLEFHLDNMVIVTQDLSNIVCADDQHKFGGYTFHAAAGCDEAGTEIALCQNDYCNAVDIRANAELYPAAGHTFGDYVVVPDSATCVKGTASKAICAICSAEDFIYGDDLAECVVGQKAVLSALKTPADYENAAVYYESCVNCGKLFETEFTYGTALVDNFVNGEMLYGLASGNYTTTQPTAAPYMYEMIMSETVGEAVNYYLHVEKVNKVSQNFVFFGDGKEVEGATTYVYQFDMRWGGATNRRDAVVGFVKAVYKGADGKWVELKPLGGEGSTTSWSVSLNSSTDNGPLNVANKSIGAMAVGEWVTMRYELTQNADKSWNIDVYVGDTLVQSNATAACETVPVIRYETRYGKNSSTTNCDQSYDIDNVIIYAK